MSDETISDPRMVQAMDEAGAGVVALWLDALLYSARYLTDGVLTAPQLSGLRTFQADRVGALLAAGLWAKGEAGGISIVGYLELQPSAERARRDREAARRRAEDARKRRRQPPALRTVPALPERPAGPSDHVAPGPLCGVEWCDGKVHFRSDPETTPRGQQEIRACPNGPLASRGRRSA